MGERVLSRLASGIQRLSVGYYRERIWALSIGAAAGVFCHIDRATSARYSASSR